jgi:hypothetical protein
MTKSAFIRPSWTPLTIALMVLGFIIYWPLGLAMIAYILWGDRLDEFKSEVNQATDRFTRSWGRGAGEKTNKNTATGNVAFDDWRKAELTRLEEQRRKLDEMRAEFDEYARELRRARDQQEFDSFMAARGKQSSSYKPSASSAKTVPSTPEADT